MVGIFMVVMLCLVVVMLMPVPRFVIAFPVQAVHVHVPFGAPLQPFRCIPAHPQHQRQRHLPESRFQNAHFRRIGPYQVRLELHCVEKHLSLLHSRHNASVQIALDRLQFLCCNQIDLVQHHNVRHRDLVQRQPTVFVVKRQDIVCIHHNQNAVEPHQRPDFWRQENICDSDRIRYTAGLDDDVLRRVLPLQQFQRRFQQVAANRAANAAVRQIDRFTFDTDDQLCVNVDRPKIVHQRRNLQTVIAVQNMVEQRSFARAEKAADNRQWHLELLVPHIRRPSSLVIHIVPGSRQPNSTLVQHSHRSRKDRCSS